MHTRRPAETRDEPKSYMAGSGRVRGEWRRGVNQRAARHLFRMTGSGRRGSGATPGRSERMGRRLTVEPAQRGTCMAERRALRSKICHARRDSGAGAAGLTRAREHPSCSGRLSYSARARHRGGVRRAALVGWVARQRGFRPAACRLQRAGRRRSRLARARTCPAREHPPTAAQCAALRAPR